MAYPARRAPAWPAAVTLLLVASLTASELPAAPPYPWLRGAAPRDSLAARVEPPPGYQRMAAPPGSFASWLRGLPLRPHGTVVRLFDGRTKARQDGVYAVVDIDTGSRDLQQCADAVIRLRAEYLRQAGCASRVAFDFTSGQRAAWLEWSAGRRPEVSGTAVRWIARARPDSSYASFRRYLDTVFTYAGSASLSRELEVVRDPATVLPGDVFIQGGFPGHAVLVADVATSPHGARVFLLVQSYMPAQDVHVLRNPTGPGSPWYPARTEGVLETPEWTFRYADLRRFPEPDCAPARGISDRGP